MPLKRMQGIALGPVLEGETPDNWRQSVYYHYYDHGRHDVARHAGVRTETHKLIHFYTGDMWELHDLEADPLELNNVYGTPGAAAVQSALEAEYLRLRGVYGVPPETFEAPFREHSRGRARLAV